MWGSVFNPQQFRNTAYKRPLNIDNNILKINIDFIFFARCDMDKKMFAQREFLLLIPPIQESITLWQRAVEAIFGRDLTYFIWSSNFWPRKVKIPQILFISHQQFIRAHSCPPHLHPIQDRHPISTLKFAWKPSSIYLIVGVNTVNQIFFSECDMERQNSDSIHGSTMDRGGKKLYWNICWGSEDRLMLIIIVFILYLM